MEPVFICNTPAPKSWYVRYANRNDRSYKLNYSFYDMVEGPVNGRVTLNDGDSAPEHSRLPFKVPCDAYIQKALKCWQIL